jgi:hypothetical protein
MNSMKKVKTVAICPVCKQEVKYNPEDYASSFTLRDNDNHFFEGYEFCLPCALKILNIIKSLVKEGK